MARCSTIRHNSTTVTTTTASSPLDILEVIRRLQSVGFCLDLDCTISPADHSKDKLSPLFHHVLTLFFDEILLRGALLPFPPHHPDDGGSPIDLFGLHSIVRGMGGYDAVTAAKRWPAVAAELGMDVRAGTAVKLVYAKYLDALDRWLKEVLQKNEVVEVTTGDDTLKDAVGADEKIELTTTPSRSKVDWLCAPTKEKQDKVALESSGEKEDAEIVVVENEKAMVAVDSYNGKSGSKRKKEGLVGMIHWVKRMAKSPYFISGRSKSNVQVEVNPEEIDEFKVAILVRKAMFGVGLKIEGSLIQKRQKVSPSIYESPTDASHTTDHKIRSSQKILNKQPSGDSTTSRRLRSCSAAALSQDPFHECTFVDPYPQGRASIPLWTGRITSMDDEKWLGTQVWPPETTTKKTLVRQDRIGKGREEVCRCKQRGSVECVRFHVAEKRLQLKLELGRVFHTWRFDRMGEEVALSWTEDEERKFKDKVRMSLLSVNKSFWNDLFSAFPYKSRQSLVSYYFNVFLVRRRSFQNRVTPRIIDSDDEEPEFGFLSNSFGHETVTAPVIKPIICTQNSQCFDLDEFIDFDYQTILDDFDWDL